MDDGRASYIERVQGELYYMSTVNFKRPNACWDNANFYGANGDGYLCATDSLSLCTAFPAMNHRDVGVCLCLDALLPMVRGAVWDSLPLIIAPCACGRYYPGRASANASFSIGGKTDIPIESARLKHIRDGFEDNEWLRLLEKHKGRAAVLRLIQPFITNAWTFADNATALLSVRAAVGSAIEAALRDV